MTLSHQCLLSCGRLASVRLWNPVEKTALYLPGVYSVRWRKPRWFPTAKSKLFRVPQHKQIPEEEAAEILRLYNIYRTQMRAVRHHLLQEYIRKEKSLEKAADIEEVEHRKLMEYNEQENQRVAAIREERIQKQWEDAVIRAEETKQKKADIAAKEEEEALQLILKTQELVKSFIKREDLEKAIETAIANPRDYNYSMDDKGYVYQGRFTKPQDVPEDQREKITASQ